MEGGLIHCVSSSNRVAHREFKASKPGRFDRNIGLGLEPRTRHEIKSFGTCLNEAGWIALGQCAEEDRERFLDMLFEPLSGCGFSFCRLPMGANDFSERWRSYDETDGDFSLSGFSLDDDEKYIFPYARAALRRNPDTRFFASPWSPPTWMKVPPIHNGGRFRMDARYLDAYARYFLAYVEGCARRGIPIEQVHIQNEPISPHRFPSCVWTGPELGTFIRDYLGPTFEAADCKAEIWLGTLNGPDSASPIGDSGFNGYANLVLKDAKARKHIAGVGYQWAGKHEVAKTRQSWPNVRLMQTEAECGDGANSWDGAFYLFDLARRFLYDGCERFAYWNAVLAPGGMSTWGWPQNSMATASTGGIILNPDYWVMHHLCGALPPGSRLVGTCGAWSANSIASISPDGTASVCVVNPFSGPERFELEGVASAELGPRSVTTFKFIHNEEIRHEID